MTRRSTTAANETVRTRSQVEAGHRSLSRVLAPLSSRTRKTGNASSPLHRNGLATLAVIGAAATRNFWLVPLALAAGYGLAWFAHFFLEKNRPATFTHPFWSLMSDYRMAWMWATGRLGTELAKAGVARR